jgi:hypothetical protein
MKISKEKLYKIQNYIIFGIILLLLFVFLPFTPKKSITADTFVVATSNLDSPVTVTDAHIARLGGTFTVAGKIRNSSDVPVTLVILNLKCNEVNVNYDKEVLVGYETVEETKQTIPIEIKVGETYDFKTSIQQLKNAYPECSVEVKSWGKYGAGN